MKDVAIRKQTNLSFQTANKASVLNDFLFVILLGSEISKGVNDDTKDEVENNDDDHEEEEHIVDESQGVEWLRA